MTRDLTQSRVLLDRRLAVVCSLKPTTPAQELLIQAMRDAVSWLDDTHAAAGIVERQLKAGWLHLDHLLELHAAMVIESREPPQDLDATAEFIVPPDDLAADHLAAADRTRSAALRLMPLSST